MKQLRPLSSINDRKLALIAGTTAITLDGGPLNRPIVATVKHASRTAARHVARELAKDLVHRHNAYKGLIQLLRGMERYARAGNSIDLSGAWQGNLQHIQKQIKAQLIALGECPDEMTTEVEG
jgi:hypothetical protein